MTLVHPPTVDLLGPAAVPDADRRRFRRVRLDRPVKLRCDDDNHSQHAECVDASAGGVLIRLQSDHRLEPGQRIRVGIPAERNSALLLADDLVEATVVRCLSHGDAHYLAAAFDVPVFLADAG
ncbi:MAG: PilZ domain-containing protein [Planctomycetota bacterium]